jgi:general secretion pathway protein D
MPTAVAAGSHEVKVPVSARQARAAEDAYLAGAKRLERDDLDGAETAFARALKLNPASRDYALAIAVTREHKVTELVQRSTQARRTGDAAKAETLLAEARAIDPENAIVLEHMPRGVFEEGQSKGLLPAGLSDRAQMIAAKPREPWMLDTPALAGPIQLKFNGAPQQLHLRGDSRDVMQQLVRAFGIHAIFDDSVERRTLRFDMDRVGYEKAIAIVGSMAHVFAVPLDEFSVLIVKDDTAHRQEYARQVEETIYLPGLTIEQINDLANVVRNVFEVKQASVQTGLQSMIVRAPYETMAPMNRTLSDLMDGNGEVMLDLKLYTVDTTHTQNIGATLPTQGGVYSVEAEATKLVNANQTLVNQAIAQGLLTGKESNIVIAGALIASGLVTSTLFSQTVGVFGHGLTQTGITASTNIAFNFGLNSSAVRALDDIQVRIGDRGTANFRAGSKYPITTSTYSTGLSTAAAGATINGVNVASLLAQYAGGSSATVPQVTYEDLGVTLKATPVIQKSGRVAMHLDLKLEALAGGSANGIPILASRQFVSDITLVDGESALMVSNLSTNEAAAVSGIPGLSDLPGFQVPVEKNGEKDTSQLVLVVTPHVVRRRSNLIAGPRIVVRPQEPIN